MATTSFLSNRYWVLRHGKSIPNERGLIVSSLENGVLEKYQLAPEGVIQARSAGELFRKELEDSNIPLENVRICYSPFARTAQTASTVASVLNLPFDGKNCKVIEDLRERYFGPSFELQSHERYSDIWSLDENDPFQKPEEGGESASDVVSRLLKAMECMETEFQGCVILVVSHGDPLQMLQTILNAAKENPGPGCNSLIPRLEAVKVSSVLSKHRRFALETGNQDKLSTTARRENTRSHSDLDMWNRLAPYVVRLFGRHGPSPVKKSKCRKFSSRGFEKDPGSPGYTTAGNKNEVSPPSSSPKWERLVFESRLFYLGVSAYFGVSQICEQSYG